jgi:hypothetical protein
VARGDGPGTEVSLPGFLDDLEDFVREYLGPGERPPKVSATGPWPGGMVSRLIELPMADGSFVAVIAVAAPVPPSPVEWDDLPPGVQMTEAEVRSWLGAGNTGPDAHRLRRDRVADTIAQDNLLLRDLLEEARSENEAWRKMVRLRDERWAGELDQALRGGD